MPIPIARGRMVFSPFCGSAGLPMELVGGVAPGIRPGLPAAVPITDDNAVALTGGVAFAGTVALIVGVAVSAGEGAGVGVALAVDEGVTVSVGEGVGGCLLVGCSLTERAES